VVAIRKSLTTKNPDTGVETPPSAEETTKALIDAKRAMAASERFDQQQRIGSKQNEALRAELPREAAGLLAEMQTSTIPIADVQNLATRVALAYGDAPLPPELEQTMNAITAHADEQVAAQAGPPSQQRQPRRAAPSNTPIGKLRQATIEEAEARSRAAAAEKQAAETKAAMPSKARYAALVQQNHSAGPNDPVVIVNPNGNVVQVLGKTLTEERVKELHAAGFTIPGLD
jgi:hypothetical protein